MRLFRLFSALGILLLMQAVLTPAVGSARAVEQAGPVPQPKSIVEITASDPRFSTFFAAVKAAGLVDALNTPGPFTIFVPTNAAFKALPSGALDALLKDPEKLKSILLYHVVARKLLAADLLQFFVVDSVAQLPVVFTVKYGLTFINNARISAVDIQAENGVIYTIDRVILPPDKDLIDTTAATAQFSTLTRAIQAAGLANILKGSGPFTLFAPTDEAFARLPKGALDALLKDPEKLQSILLYHVVPKVDYSGEVSSAASAASLNGADLVFNVKSRQTFVNDARIISADTLAMNGVIHGIDTVLIPPEKTIAEILTTNPQFSTLAAAIKTAGLAEMLDGADPYTLLAPTNTAFVNLPVGIRETLFHDPEKLKSLLLYHTIPGKVYSGNVARLSSAQTVDGRFISFGGKRSRLTVNNARFPENDILAANGVIHLVDTVLLPPSKDMFDTLSANSQFGILLRAAKASGFAENLKGRGPYTFFAPTDSAFTRLPAKTLDALLKDPEKMHSVLLYHLSSGRLFSGDFARMPSASMFTGGDVALTPRYNLPFANNARITGFDILTTNGVIHIIDAVLLPPDKDIVEIVASGSQFKTLSAAIQAAGLVDMFKGKAPYTLFAPTDAAFAKLPKGTLDALRKDPAKLKRLLLSHTVPGALYAGAALKLEGADSASRVPLTFTVQNGQLYVNTAHVLTGEFLATNGVIHAIDTVLLPGE